MKFPTGGDAVKHNGQVRDPGQRPRLIWCESKTDSKVWMKEGEKDL